MRSGHLDDLDFAGKRVTVVGLGIEGVDLVRYRAEQAGLALGATKWQTIWHHVLPAGADRILTGTVLAISRALGETAPLVVVGASTFLTIDPVSPFSRFTTLPIQIYQWTSRPQGEFKNLAAAAILACPETGILSTKLYVELGVAAYAMLSLLALARAWALQPDVWLLDEPTASLDPHAKRDVETLIADFGDELPATGRRPPTLVLASHNLGQVKRLASRVIYLEQGRVLADLPVHDFFNQDLLEQRSPQANAFVKGETT